MSKKKRSTLPARVTTLNEASLAGLSDDDIDRLQITCAQFDEWAHRLRLPHEARIELCYKTVKQIEETTGDSGRDFKPGMVVDDSRADYFFWRIDVTDFCLRPERDTYREMDVIHECIHLMLYGYVSTAYGLIHKRYFDLLRQREESIATQLEIAFWRLKYGDNCTLPLPLSR